MSISFRDGHFRVRFSGVTDIGQVRDHNEDNLLIAEHMPLAVVSDGMGGHASGEVASSIAVQTVNEYYQRTASDPAITWPFRLPELHVQRDRMSVSIKLANTRIFETGRGDPSKKGMGCTVDAIFFAQGRFYIGHVGDSRVYRIRRGQISQLTDDHSLLNDYKRMKEMSGAEVENFPHKNVVVRALGLAEQVYVDILVDEYQRDDLYLLCSDGLCGMLDDETMMQASTRFASIDTAAQMLVKLANEAGGNDNITALLVRIEG
ncbi:MAG: Stp1/IreP family PP2C-type Ser/Thr phosphatase [Myxococcales bacterium]|nr:Stp1/IreP family PP2C-type Ser/Thr phosphatase [Myxococcales bacterium]